MQDGAHCIAIMMHVTCKEGCDKNEVVIMNSAMKTLQLPIERQLRTSVMIVISHVNGEKNEPHPIETYFYCMQNC